MIFHIHAGYEKSTTKIINHIKLFQSWKVCYHFTAYANLSIIFYGICKILSTILWYMKILQISHYCSMAYANLYMLFYGIYKYSIPFYSLENISISFYGIIKSLIVILYADHTMPFTAYAKVLNSILKQLQIFQYHSWHIKISQCHFKADANFLLLFHDICKSVIEI